MGTRDTNYGWISYSPAEGKIIDTTFFQRLRYVSQMSSVHLVFPGACTNRFTHSLGAMHLSGLYMETLLKSAPATLGLDAGEVAYFVQLARLCGLLHDIAHGPFSHSFDRTVYQAIYGIADGGHDLHRVKIIHHPTMRTLIEACDVDVIDMVAVWNKQPELVVGASKLYQDLYRVISNITQGPLGADRMDFTLRDARCAGTEHFGTIAYDRIIANSLLAERDGHWYLHYQAKALPDMVHALSGRFHMYMNVYFHKTAMAADMILEKMLMAASKELQLIARTENLEEFQWLNDQIIGEIRARCALDSAAYVYMQRYLSRQLPKLQVEKLVRTSEKSIALDKSIEALAPGVEVVHSKTVENLDSEKFSQRGIYFWAKNKSITCQEALVSHNYPTSVQYLHCVRTYLS